MNNNQHNTKNTVYQYTVTANSDINYDINKPANPNLKVNIVKPNIVKGQTAPALARAMKALQLVNPFRGV